MRSSRQGTAPPGSMGQHGGTSRAALIGVLGGLGVAGLGTLYVASRPGNSSASASSAAAPAPPFPRGAYGGGAIRSTPRDAPQVAPHQPRVDAHDTAATPHFLRSPQQKEGELLSVRRELFPRNPTPQATLIKRFEKVQNFSHVHHTIGDGLSDLDLSMSSIQPDAHSDVSGGMHLLNGGGGWVDVASPAKSAPHDTSDDSEAASPIQYGKLHTLGDVAESPALARLCSKGVKHIMGDDMIIYFGNGDVRNLRSIERHFDCAFLGPMWPDTIKREGHPSESVWAAYKRNLPPDLSDQRRWQRMRRLLTERYRNDSDSRNALASTRLCMLVYVIQDDREDAQHWGVSSKDGQGLNLLGLLTMIVREDLCKHEEPDVRKWSDRLQNQYSFDADSGTFTDRHAADNFTAHFYNRVPEIRETIENSARFGFYEVHTGSKFMSAPDSEARSLEETAEPGKQYQGWPDKKEEWVYINNHGYLPLHGPYGATRAPAFPRQLSF